MTRAILRSTSACLVALCWGSAGVAQAEDFRIHSRVFIGDGQVARENITLFHAERVYDFMTQPPAVTVFEPTRARFVLLDPVRQRQTEVTLESLDQFLADLRRQASESDNPLLKFLAQPQFRESTGAGGEMLLASPWMTYRLKTSPAQDRAASRRYREFSDGFAKLNTLTNPASLPPFARLAVNAALDRSGVLPSEVALTIVTQARPERKEITYQSRHHVQWRLLEEDLSRVAQADSDLEGFAFVPLEQYFSGDAPGGETGGGVPQEARRPKAPPTRTR